MEQLYSTLLTALNVQAVVVSKLTHRSPVTRCLLLFLLSLLVSYVDVLLLGTVLKACEGRQARAAPLTLPYHTPSSRINYTLGPFIQA